ncbi:RICIN domain-containing protein [Nonomuraea sp. NPDC049709]|uniref:RICIN domain-containing protein n=1 Tax=Nonomuraea sp. NPDC049709 TaxID=3154736 RepID=UPI00342AF58F
MTQDPVDRRSPSRRTVLATMGALPVLAATPPAVGASRTAAATAVLDPSVRRQHIRGISGMTHDSGKVLDVDNFSTADGAAIVQWADGNGTNQQWQLVRVG